MDVERRHLAKVMPHSTAGSSIYWRRLANTSVPVFNEVAPSGDHALIKCKSLEQHIVYTRVLKITRVLWIELTYVGHFMLNYSITYFVYTLSIIYLLCLFHHEIMVRYFQVTALTDMYRQTEYQGVFLSLDRLNHFSRSFLSVAICNRWSRNTHPENNITNTQRSYLQPSAWQFALSAEWVIKQQNN